MEACGPAQATRGQPAFPFVQQGTSVWLLSLSLSTSLTLPSGYPCPSYSSLPSTPLAVSLGLLSARHLNLGSFLFFLFPWPSGRTIEHPGGRCEAGSAWQLLAGLDYGDAGGHHAGSHREALYQPRTLLQASEQQEANKKRHACALSGEESLIPPKVWGRASKIGGENCIFARLNLWVKNGLYSIPPCSAPTKDTTT